MIEDYSYEVNNDQAQLDLENLAGLFTAFANIEKQHESDRNTKQTL